jgi:branched-chain amino acid transport system substrate-binding protein
VVVTSHTLTIYLSEPPGFASDPNLADVVDAEKLAFEQDSNQVTGYKLRLAPINLAEVTDNARIAIQDTSAIAYVGELQAGTSVQTVGITQDQDLLELSPTDTQSMVSTDFESLSTYGRNYMRVPGGASAEAAALVAEMKTLGVSSVYVADDGSAYGKAEAAAVRSAASSGGGGVSVSNSESGAGAIFYGSDSVTDAATFFKAAASASSSAKLFAPSGLYSPAFSSAVSSLQQPLYVSVPGLLPSALKTAQPSFATQFTTDYDHAPSVQAVLGYEAMTGLISALKSAGAKADSRTTVIKEIRKQKFAPTGFVIARLQGGTLVPWKAAPAATG